MTLCLFQKSPIISSFPTFPSTTPDPSSESSLESLHPWVRAHHKASGMGRASLLEVKDTGRKAFYESIIVINLIVHRRFAIGELKIL